MYKLDRSRALSEIKKLLIHHPREDRHLGLLSRVYHVAQLYFCDKYFSYKLVILTGT